MEEVQVRERQDVKLENRWEKIGRVLYEAEELGMDSVSTTEHQRHRRRISTWSWDRISFEFQEDKPGTSLWCTLNVRDREPGENWTKLMSRYKRTRARNKMEKPHVLCVSEQRYWTLKFSYLKSEIVTIYQYLWIDAGNYQTVSLEGLSNWTTTSWLPLRR